MVFAVFQWYELMALAEMNASGDWQFSYVAWDKKQAVKDDPKFPEKWGCHLLKWQKPRQSQLGWGQIKS